VERAEGRLRTLAVYSARLPERSRPSGEGAPAADRFRPSAGAQQATAPATNHSSVAGRQVEASCVTPPTDSKLGWMWS